MQHENGVAYAVASGAVLAHAPDHWTDGCPVLEEEQGPRLVVRSYLDPISGTLLLVEAVPKGEPRTVDMRPTRWTQSAGQQSSAA